MPTWATYAVYRDRLQTIEKHLKYFKCDNVILQGDFNIDVDRHSGSKQTIVDFEDFLERWELQDVWRLQNPTSNRCAHFHVRQQSRRLDYCFVSLNFMCHVSKCKIGNAYCSDHSPILSEFVFNLQGGRKPF